MRTPIIASSIWSWYPCLWLADRVGNRILFRKKSSEYTRNSFRYSPEDSAHSEAFWDLRKRLFRSSERKEIAWKNLFYKKSCSSKQNLQHVFVWDMLQNGIPSCCLFHGMVRNRIPRVCLFFCSFKGILSCFLFHGMVQYVIPSICL